MAMVLCTGADRILSETRALILRRAGHTAISAVGEQELIEACSRHSFDVAVIGQAMPTSEKRYVFRLVRQHCTSAKILEVYAPHLGRVLEDADDWLEDPARVPSDLAAHVAGLAALN
jgi:hypothetical protein